MNSLFLNSFHFRNILHLNLNWTPLHFAVDKNGIEIVKLLINLPNIEINAVSNDSFN